MLGKFAQSCNNCNKGKLSEGHIDDNDVHCIVIKCAVPPIITEPPTNHMDSSVFSRILKLITDEKLKNTDN